MANIINQGAVGSPTSEQSPNKALESGFSDSLTRIQTEMGEGEIVAVRGIWTFRSKLLT